MTDRDYQHSEPEKKVCWSCGVPKQISEFSWSQKKKRPTKTCLDCSYNKPNLLDPKLKPGRLVPNLIAIYEEVRLLMEQIHRASFEQLVREEWDEQAMRVIMRGLVIRAADGDREAAKLILDVRLKLKAQGDGSEEDVLNLAALLADDPLRVDESSA